MRMKQLTENLLWLPGFSPEEDPLEVLGAASDAKQQVQVRDHVEVVAAEQAVSVAHKPVSEPVEKTVWAKLPSDFLGAVSGLKAKFQHNVAAIELLKKLRGEKRKANAQEARTLSLYTGWGGLPHVFNDNPDAEWADAALNLKSMLSEQEYAAARASTLNAHFTPAEVVEAMWKLVGRLGFSGGRILDPCSGAGFFLGLMPEEISKASTVSAVEPDSICAEILRSIYGQHGVKVNECGFEALKVSANHYDLTISNVPFGDYGVAELRNVQFANFRIHDYFFARAMEVTRPGGLVVFITSTGTMDKQESGVRRYLASQAKFLGGIRLPGNTFAKSANTSISADILVFQKLEEGESTFDFSWTASSYMRANTVVRGFSSHTIQLNSYWVNNPEHVIGEFSLTSTRFGGHQVVSKFDGDLSLALEDVISHFPESVYEHRVREVDATPPSSLLHVIPEEGIRAGYVLRDGVVYESDGFQLVEVVAPAMQLGRLASLCSVKESARKLIDAQVHTEDETILSRYRLALNIAYDNFVSKFGYINDKMNVRALKSDSDFPLLLSLEHWNAETNTAEKADIFTRTTVRAFKKVDSAESVEEALNVCMVEFGQVVPARIAELVRQTEDEVTSELVGKGLIFLCPEKYQYVHAAYYLSGPVRTKLLAAESAGFGFEMNVKALERVIPADLGPHEISARIGSTWIPYVYYSQFLSDVFGGEVKDHKVVYSSIVGSWDCRFDYTAKCSHAAKAEFGTARINGVELFMHALNQTLPEIKDKDYRTGNYVINRPETIVAREKLDALKGKFIDWVWSEAERASALVRCYNDIFNNQVDQEFDGSSLTFPGYTWYVTPHKHQFDSVWRILTSNRNTLLGHTVGAGKTLTMIMAAMEMRRMGKASKPLITVPNHMLYQVGAEFLQAYPSARILLASKDDLVGDKRRVMLSRIATGDWDCVIITHSSFERIPLSPERTAAQINDQIQLLENEKSTLYGDSRSNKIVKELERAKTGLKARLTKLSAQSKKDDVLFFEDLGIDMLQVDEAHLFKNLHKITKMVRVAGLPLSKSQRAFDMYGKVEYINDMHDGMSGVVFATGTHVSNSMAEMWVMQKYLQNHTLKRMNMETFDSWAANFGEAVTSLELSPDGQGYRMQTRFARFVNLPELLGMFNEVADIRTREMLNLPTPDVERISVVVESNDVLKSVVANLVERYERIRSGGVRPEDDNALKITGDGRKAALDLRLVGREAPKGVATKITSCADKVWQEYSSSTDILGTQLVFCDQGTPTGSSIFNVYDALRDQLVAKGIPDEEIAYIHNYDTDAAKANLFKAVRAGVIRVLIGSTQMCGVGTNVQTRMVAIHHLDAPWRPADLEQRDGRGIRQGNMNLKIRIYTYITEGSFDSYIFQCLETKARFIAQVSSGKTGLRTVEDVTLATLTYAEVKALASGNPLVLEKAGIDAELAKLSLVYSDWKRSQCELKYSLIEIPRQIERHVAHVVAMKEDLSAWEAVSGKPITFNLNGVHFGAVEGGKQIQRMTANLQFGESRPVGTVAGFVITAGLGRENTKRLRVNGKHAYSEEMGSSGKSAVEAFVSMMDGIRELIVSKNRLIALYETQLKDVEANIDRPFDKMDRLQHLEQRQAELDNALDLSKSDVQSVDAANDETAVSDVEAA